MILKVILFFITTQLSFADESISIDKAVKLFDEVKDTLNQQLSSNCNFEIEDNSLCDIYNVFKGKGVPDIALKDALIFYSKNKEKFKNQRYISIADYSMSSSTKRFYLLDLSKLELSRFKVSHGSGSSSYGKMGDPDHDGHIDRCSYKGSRTNMTRPGFFVTGELYLSSGKNNSHIETKNSRGDVVKGWPYLSSLKRSNALRLDGLSVGVNDKARSNGVVMHGAWYNNTKVTKSELMGRSYGCPAFSTVGAKKIIPKIKDGSLYYSYVPKCKKDMLIVKKNIKDEQISCN